MSNTIHKTRGIVLKCVKYGDTSLVASIYTELFGLQSYIIKGVRKTSKKGLNNANYFLPAAILELQVYHNEQKQLQFLKEYQWHYLYNNIFYDVIKNAVAVFSVELLQHSIKQPETNIDLYEFIENSLIGIDKAESKVTANFPLYFSLNLGKILGFGIEGNYSIDNCILDLQEGYYCNTRPHHSYFIENNLAAITSTILSCETLNKLENILLNKNTRRQLIDFYNQYFALHITNFSELRSVEVLKEVLE